MILKTDEKDLLSLFIINELSDEYDRGTILNDIQNYISVRLSLRNIIINKLCKCDDDDSHEIQKYIKLLMIIDQS